MDGFTFPAGIVTEWFKSPLKTQVSERLTIITHMAMLSPPYY